MINDHIFVSSRVEAKCAEENSKASLNFKISANINAKVAPLDPDGPASNSLEVSIDVVDCKAGGMLSDEWSSPYKHSSGYFLDSVIIWVVPISNKSNHNRPLYVVEGSPKPWHINKDIQASEIQDNNKWELIADGCGRTRVGWKY